MARKTAPKTTRKPATSKPRCPDCDAPMERAGCYSCALSAQCRALGVGEPVPEYSFNEHGDGPAYRYDFAWPEIKLFVEIQGGIWSGGAHGRPQGILRDMAKARYAVAQGWRVAPFTPDELVSGEVAVFVQRMGA